MIILRVAVYGAIVAAWLAVHARRATDHLMSSRLRSAALVVVRLQAGRVALRIGQVGSCSGTGLVDALLLLLHLLVEVLIVVVPVERLLEDLLVQQLRVLLDLSAVLVAPLAIRVRRVEVVGVRWNERSWDALVQQIVPGEVTQPRVVLDVLRTVQTETVERLPLNQTIYEVRCLDSPAWRNVSAPNLHLSCKDVLTDLAPVPARVRPPAKHALVANDAHSKVVDSDTMRLSAHDLRRHVTRRARRIFLVLRIPYSRDTEVSDLKIAITVKDEVLGLDITMQNALLMEILESQQHASNEESRLLFVEFLVLGQVIAQVTTLHEINDEE